MADEHGALRNGADSTIPSPAIPPRRWRFQFSLASLLWLTTVAACLAALWAMYRDLQQTKAELRASCDEVQKYRDEMGYLEVTDPKKVYVRGVRTMSASKWSWRAHCPAIPNSCFAYQHVQFQRTGFRPGKRAIILEPGERLLDAGIEPGPGGKWRFHFATFDGSVHDSEMEPLNSRFDLTRDVQTIGVNETRQEAAYPGLRLVLLQLRKMKITQGSPDGPHSSTTDGEPCDGVMVWIEEHK